MDPSSSSLSVSPRGNVPLFSFFYRGNGRRRHDLVVLKCHGDLVMDLSFFLLSG